MTGTDREPARESWTVGRVVGGQEQPTRFQLFIARHPLGVGLGVGTPLMVIFTSAALLDHAPENSVTGACFGAALGGIYGLTALGERHRQRRLGRRGPRSRL
ncbi:hypothetical protein [Streptomyces sp. 8N706]|uniref:hypothetical protein n=1 Tax=Streptomyces sp. 8N706 TaxID=3457416 RepID=UPI003FCFA735